jgi:hypothetical protein
LKGSRDRPGRGDRGQGLAGLALARLLSVQSPLARRASRQT